MNAKDYTDDDDFSRGAGDPDTWGYPGETPQSYKEFDPNGKHPDWVVVDLKPIHWSELEDIKPKPEMPETEWGDVY